MIKFEQLQARYITPEMKQTFSLGSVDGQERILGPKRHIIVLQAMTEEGIPAWATIPTTKLPIYTSESTIESWALLKELGGNILGQEFDNPDDPIRSLGYLVGHEVLKSGFANLYIDALAQQQNLPLSVLLGGTKRSVDVGISLPTTVDFERVQEVLKLGYRIIKMKISPTENDIGKITKVREAFPDLQLMVDANSSFNLRNPNHKELLMKLGALNLLMIEQPLAHDDIMQHIELQQKYYLEKIPGRICLDESIHTIEHVIQAIEGGISIINIKIPRVGGMHIAKEMIEYCQQNKVDTWIGGMIGLTAIDKANSVAMATLPGVTLPGDISGTEAYFLENQDPTTEPMVVENSQVTVPDTIGRGWQVDEEKLTNITTRSTTFRSRKQF